VVPLLRLGFVARAFTRKNGNATGRVRAELAVLYLRRERMQCNEQVRACRRRREGGGEEGHAKLDTYAKRGVPYKIT
jgi:hypothetical protein